MLVSAAQHCESAISVYIHIYIRLYLEPLSHPPPSHPSRSSIEHRAELPCYHWWSFLLSDTECLPSKGKIGEWLHQVSAQKQGDEPLERRVGEDRWEGKIPLNIKLGFQILFSKDWVDQLNCSFQIFLLRGRFLCLFILSVWLELPSREGTGTPLQDSCLENPMDRGAW